MQKILNLIFLTSFSLTLVGCGQMGPLYLPTPDKSESVKNSPA